MRLTRNLYEKIVYNENIYNKEIGYEIGFYNHFKMFIYCIGFTGNILKSKIIKKERKEEYIKIGISWNDLHKKKIELVDIDLNIFNIKSNQLLKTVHYPYLKDVNISEALLFGFKHKGIRNKFSYQSFFYRIYIHLLYDFLFSLIKKREEVFVSGHFDRVVSILSEVCNTNNIKLNIIQHGCLQIFEKPLIKNILKGNIYYSHKFSLPFFSTFFHEINNIDFIKLDEVKPKIDYYHKCSKKIIVYGCQDAKPKNNILIIDFLLNMFNNKLIYVIPHPREDLKFYSKYRHHLCNAFVSRTKPVNAEFFVSRFSTLGIEYSLLEIRSIFINIDMVKLDFMLSESYEIYESLEEFKKEFI